MTTPVLSLKTVAIACRVGGGPLSDDTATTLRQRKSSVLFASWLLLDSELDCELTLCSIMVLLGKGDFHMPDLAATVKGAKSTRA